MVNIPLLGFGESVTVISLFISSIPLVAGTNLNTLLRGGAPVTHKLAVEEEAVGFEALPDKETKLELSLMMVTVGPGHPE